MLWGRATLTSTFNCHLSVRPVGDMTLRLPDSNGRMLYALTYFKNVQVEPFKIVLWSYKDK